MSEPSLLVLLVDALAYEYFKAETFPRLSPLTREGVVMPVEPEPFFSGIDPALYGVPGSHIGHLTSYAYQPEKAPLRGLTPLLVELDSFPRNSLGKLARIADVALLSIIARRPFLPPQHIPIRLLTKLNHVRANSDRLSIIEMLDNEGINTIHYSRDYPLERRKRLGSRLFGLLYGSRQWRWMLEQCARNARLVHLEVPANLDRLGHRHGPELDALRPALLQVDARIHELWQAFSHNHPNPHLLIISDHGMSQVNNFIDLEKALHSEKLTSRKGVLMHSTMAQFWMEADGSMEQLSRAIRSLESVRFVLCSDFPKLGIEEDPRFGNAIALLEEGTMFLPNHFQGNQKVKGLHGYASSRQPSSFPIALFFGECWPKEKLLGERLPEKVRMTQITPTIARLLELKRDPQFSGEAIFQ